MAVDVFSESDIRRVSIPSQPGRAYTVISRYKKPPRGRPEVSYNEKFLISRLIFPYKFLRDQTTVAYIEKFVITGVSYNESSLERHAGYYDCVWWLVPWCIVNTAPQCTEDVEFFGTKEHGG